ncbi:MAG: preprotein translocase subunit SecE [Gammaproteobacteria bacterium]
MNSKIETESPRFDRFKLLAAVLLLTAGIVAFYWFAEHSLLVRVIGLLAVAGVAIAIVLQTEIGRNTWQFVQESRNELRKVVWPSRAETTQTTLVVIAMVLVVGILLWLLDMFLLWAVQLLTGRGG